MSKPTDSKICPEKSQTDIKKPEAVLSPENNPPLCDTIRVFKLSASAITPEISSDSRSAYFLFSPDKHIVPAGQNLLIQTYLQITPPAETYAHLTSIRQTAHDNKILVGAGTIDPDYTGTGSIF